MHADKIALPAFQRLVAFAFDECGNQHSFCATFFALRHHRTEP